MASYGSPCIELRTNFRLGYLDYAGIKLDTICHNTQRRCFVLFTSEYRFAGQIYFCACSSHSIALVKHCLTLSSTPSFKPQHHNSQTLDLISISPLLYSPLHRSSAFRCIHSLLSVFSRFSLRRSLPLPRPIHNIR
ncbi:hypothetical protein LENED_012045 [Lentinula edodes]|uniref:Uncharacterized protein n=1 Tax=Lentinula edodes TaxID=5353 RepID=A0A1Q3ERL0_LENED|nr:hypothetical protein LENED_012045 [Lentinula edodes]